MQPKRQQRNNAKRRTARQLRLYLGATLALGAMMAASGCHQDMWRQPKVNTFAESDFFADRQSARPLVPGTVAQGGRRLQDTPYYTGYENGRPIRRIPARAVEAFGGPRPMLERGREMFNVYCSPCHGSTGDGNGMITQRGVDYWQKLPASYHTDKLRRIEDGHIYDVLTNGFNVMYGYASRIQNVNDRWAIVSYVRALQASRDLTPAQAGPDAAQRIQQSGGHVIENSSGNPELTPGNEGATSGGPGQSPGPDAPPERRNGANNGTDSSSNGGGAAAAPTAGAGNTARPAPAGGAGAGAAGGSGSGGGGGAAQ